MKRIINADAEMSAALTEFSAEYFAEPWLESAFIAEMDKPNSAVYCCTDGETVCGVACVEDQFGDGYIHNIAVRDDRRREGIGGALMRECIDFAKKRGLEKLFLEVRVSNNAALALYGSLGFNILSVRKGFYDDPREDAYSMYLELL